MRAQKNFYRLSTMLSPPYKAISACIRLGTCAHIHAVPEWPTKNKRATGFVSYISRAASANLENHSA